MKSNAAEEVFLRRVEAAISEWLAEDTKKGSTFRSFPVSVKSYYQLNGVDPTNTLESEF